MNIQMKEVCLILVKNVIPEKVQELKQSMGTLRLVGLLTDEELIELCAMLDGGTN